MAKKLGNNCTFLHHTQLSVQLLPTVFSEVHTLCMALFRVFRQLVNGTLVILVLRAAILLANATDRAVAAIAALGTRVVATSNFLSTRCKKIKKKPPILLFSKALWLFLHWYFHFFFALLKPNSCYGHEKQFELYLTSMWTFSSPNKAIASLEVRNERHLLFLTKKYFH